MTQKLKPVRIQHNVLAVLDNFQSDLDLITLSKHISIQRIDTLSAEEQAVFDGERKLYRNSSIKGDIRLEQEFNLIHYRVGGEVFERSLERGNYVLCWRFNDLVLQPVPENYGLKPHYELEHALAALRILKDASIGLYPQEEFYIQYLGLEEKFPRSTHRAHDGYQLTKPSEVEPYRLLAAEHETLQQLYDAVAKVKQPNLHTALSRLKNQYTRAYIADRLIDVVVALEALYAGDNTNEIAFRVGLRISTHLGGTDADLRECYFNLFNAAYNLRSRLVHGSMHSTADVEKDVKKKGWQGNEAFMNELNAMFRQSLREILLHVKGDKLKQMLHEPLDKAIRRGEAFQYPDQPHSAIDRLVPRISKL